MPYRVQPGMQSTMFAGHSVGVERVEQLRCRVARTGRVPDVRDGIVLASACYQTHLAEPVPTHIVHVDLPARNYVFVASRRNPLLKGGFGHSRSPLADAISPAFVPR